MEKDDDMRRLLASSALAGLVCLPLAGPVAAQSPLAGPDPTSQTVGGPTDVGRVRASVMLGQTVYMAENPATVGLAPSEPPEDWQEIGPVADVLISGEGRVAEVVVDVGRFLGGDERMVGLGFDEIELVPDADAPRTGFFVVYTGNRGRLENSAPWDWETALSGEGRTDPNGAFTTGTPPSEAPGGGGAFVEGEDTGLMGEQRTLDGPATDVGPDGVPQGGNLSEGSPDVPLTDDRVATSPEATPRAADEALTAERGGAVTADALVGADLVGTGGEVIGQVEELVMTPEGEVSAVVVEVGGFLGIGARRVALPFDSVRMRGVGEDAALQTDYTREQIEAMEEHRN